MPADQTLELSETASRPGITPASTPPRAYAISLPGDTRSLRGSAATAAYLGFDSLLLLAASPAEPAVPSSLGDMSRFAEVAHAQGLQALCEICLDRAESDHVLVTEIAQRAFTPPPLLPVRRVDPRHATPRRHGKVRLRTSNDPALRAWWRARLDSLQACGLDGFVAIDAGQAGRALADHLRRNALPISMFETYSAAAEPDAQLFISPEIVSADASRVRGALARIAVIAGAWALREGGNSALNEAVRSVNHVLRDRLLSGAGSWRQWTGPSAPVRLTSRAMGGRAWLLAEANEGAPVAWKPPHLPPMPWQYWTRAPGFGADSNGLRGEPIALFDARAEPPVRVADRPAATAAAAPGNRIVITGISPSVDAGNFAVKCLIGQSVTVTADIFADGHEKLAAMVQTRAAGDADWKDTELLLKANERWEADIRFPRLGRHEFRIVAWIDAWGGFVRDFARKHEAGQDVTLEIHEARDMIAAALACAPRDAAAVLRAALDTGASALPPAAGGFAPSTPTGVPPASQIGNEPICDAGGTPVGGAGGQSPPPAGGNAEAPVSRAVHITADVLQNPALTEAMRQAEDRRFCTTSFHQKVQVEREAAGFSSWYELFPRSMSGDARRHGTFADVEARLAQIAAMGFDTLYFPPIHPIGARNRKGRNNAVQAAPDDVGSPYAIGSVQGGHTDIHPDLGTLDDFRRLLGKAAEHGLEIALDFAIQCAPDHPWLTQHPGWFAWRPDGSLKYAENPPKKYQDIVNVDFYAPGAVPDLWHALRDVVLFWVENGVRTFRVDNPHTKPLPFWSWLIEDVQSRHPDVIFLAEAFTSPKRMYHLAKAGFSQSYTYFTWRNDKAALADYVTELAQTSVRDYFRPHFFVNTPDINPLFLQESGRAGFLIRAALAATLSGLWGVYAGFELCESAALPGREEYLNSEKYELRPRPPRAAGDIVDEITQLNRLRRTYPALQTHFGVTFHNAFNDRILYFSKIAPGETARILVAVSLNPHGVEEADFEVPLWLFGLSDDQTIAVQDLLAGQHFQWTGKIQHLRLSPAHPYAIWQVSSPHAA